MSEWAFGEEVVDRTNKQILQECGFPDSDKCPMTYGPQERLPEGVRLSGGDFWIVENADEWITAGKTWGEL